MKEKLIELVGQLVAIRSSQDHPEEVKRVVKFVEDWLKEKDINVERLDHDTSPSLLATIPGQEKTIFFLAHLDVVPADGKDFEMGREGDRIYGRGVLDDKGPVAILMLLLDRLKEERDLPTIKMLFTSDEETGSAHGAERLAKEGIADDADAVVVLDGGELKEIVIKEKGLAPVRIKARGKEAHGAYPWEGENAIDKIIDAYHEIREMFREKMNDDPGHWHPTINLGKIQGGKIVNQVPIEAEAELDMRFTEELSEKEILDKIKEVADKYGLEVEPLGRGPMFHSAEDDPMIKSFHEAMREVIGSDVKLGHEHGATDGRFFADRDIPIWLHYPEGGNIHTRGEWAEAGSMMKILEGLEKWLRTI